MKLPLLAALLVLFSGTSLAATIHGTAFEWENFTPLPGVIVQVDTAPRQTVVTTDGGYSFGVADGNYLISAKYFEHNRLKYESSERIQVAGDGNFVLDLIMLPTLSEDEFLFEDFNEISGVDIPAREQPPAGVENNIILVAGALVALALAAFAVSRAMFPKAKSTDRSARKDKGSKKDLPANVPPPSAAAKGLPGDLAQIVKMLGANGGRMTQLEIREKVPFGEAKVSLMLTELEGRGIVRKFSRGRGNVVVLQK